MKTERHISLAHFNLLSPESDTLLFFLPPVGLKTLFLFYRPGLTRNIIRLLFFLPGPLEKSSVIDSPARSPGQAQARAKL